jgi:DNA-binding transcriptional regulator YhcF (GntR family)
VNKWFVDKQSKIPLYLQLKALTKHYISTGMIQDKERLPTVKVLSKHLGVNFETIRKAYKDLEKEGLLSTTRGRGTFANGHVRIKNEIMDALHPDLPPLEAFKSSLRRLIKSGMPLSEIGKIMDEALLEAQREEVVVFTECSEFQIREVSELLRLDLKLSIQPVLLSNLREGVETILKQQTKLLAVITTGFHFDEVQNVLADLPVKTDFVITNMSPATRRAINAFDKTAIYGLIGRDPVQLLFFKDLVKAELGIESEIKSCTINDKNEVRSILQSVDVLLVSPPVFEEISGLAPSTVPVFNVFDRVDPMSLKLLKDRLTSA